MAEPTAPRRNALARRWHGDVPWHQLLWRDMLLVGTLVNLVCTFAGLMGAAQGLDGRWAVALHFAPMPWNLFLVGALWRRQPRPAWSSGVALGWLALMLVV